MSLVVEFLAGADADLQGFFNQYEDYREGFGIEFLSAIDAHLVHIAAFPQIAPVYLETIRRQVMRRFPHGIFYEAHPTRILIVAILDLRQDEEQILKRLGH
jgi:plasmid stabilization system protein ParE